MKFSRFFRNRKPKAWREDADLIASCGLFDAAWYIHANPDVARSGAAPLAHYMDYGAAELRDPGPGFDAKQYAHMHRDDPAAIRAPLLHYLRSGKGAQSDLGSPSERRMVALEVLSGVAGLDPDFIGLKADIAQFQTPLTDGLPRTPAARAWTRLFGSLEYAYERIIFVPWLIRGGADLVAVHAARGAIERHGPQSLLFVVTDSARMDAADWLPQDAHIRVLSDFGPDLTHQDRVELVAWLIQALEPRSILNVNSAACWEAIKAKGAALSSFCDLYATLFCRDYNAEGEAAGYADLYVRATARHLKAIYFDNAAFTRELAAQFALPRSLKTRLRVVYQPIQGPVQTIDALDPGAPPSVLWAGRLCRQKNVELLVRIARAAPGFQFDVYGSGEPTYEAIAAEASRSLGNLTCHGVYSSFDVIPTQSFGSFLYTTHFDGLPNVLLAAAAAGLPIVAPAIGGIGELVDADTGWLVADTDNPDAYIAALEDIRRYPEETLRRVSAMRERILTRHAWSQYMNSMLISPSFLQD